MEHDELNESDQDRSVPAVKALLVTSARELVDERGKLQAAALSAGLTPDQIREVLNSRADLPRPLLPEERATLSAVLSHTDFAGRNALLQQADAVAVVGYCGCGCASVDLTVDPATPKASETTSPIPNEAEVLDAAGESVGGVIVFLKEGRLALLEVYSHFEPISPFPPLERLRLLQTQRR